VGVRPPSRVRLGWIVLAGLVALYLSWQLLHWIPLPRELSGELLMLVITLYAAGAAAGASWRAGGSRRLRRAWGLVSLALLAQAAGTVAGVCYEAAGAAPYPSLADPLYLSFYPLLLVGVLSFPVGRRTARQALELTLDSAIVTLGAGMVFDYFILGPSAIAASTPLETITSVAYPVGDMILLVALGTTLLRGAVAQTRRSLWLIAIAITLFAVADFIYGYIVLHGVYYGGDPINILYMLAFACFAAAALRQQAIPPGNERLPNLRTSGSHASGLPYLAIAAGMAILLTEEYHEPLFPNLSIAIILTLTFALVIVRQILSQANVSRSRERLAQAQQIAQIGTWEWDLEREVVERSEGDMRMHGLDPDTPPMTLAETMNMIHPEDRERVERIVVAAVDSGERFVCEMRIVRPDSEVRTLQMSGQAQRRASTVRWVRGTHQDITDRKHMETQLKYQADHDPLTGLYNRRRFAEELDLVLRNASRYKRHGALLMLDLDDFKVLNDTHGHAAGDRALKALGQAILNRVRASDVVARLGGDEFAVVLPEADERQALAVAEDIRADVAASGDDAETHITCGLVPFDEHWDLLAHDVLIAADIALYEAKEKGKNRVQIYHGDASAAVTWVERIRSALAQNRFILYAQPMIDLRSGVVTHSELLIRMIAEDGETIGPGSFLPSAERFGLINEIDRWVTREGLRLAADGQRVSINLSAHSISDASILDAVRTAISAGVDAQDVIFEITESAAARNMDEARTFTEALVTLGCEVALDDFGTGFGAFTYLKHLPARYLKIDTEFVSDMISNPTDRHVVDAITKIAHSLGMQTIAEGVEDAATLQALRDYGVDRAQGFFLGRPQPISPPTSHEQATRQLTQIEDLSITLPVALGT
jgi:diguanylate cyclase (GGDEF)-like protein/PAS domain S-box-containing protein